MSSPCGPSVPLVEKVLFNTDTSAVHINGNLSRMSQKIKLQTKGQL